MATTPTSCPAEAYLPPGRHVVYKGVTLDPEPFTKYNIDRVQDLHFRSDDVFIPGYCKTGTTWIQEIIWLICNAADVDTARSTALFDRVKMLELQLMNQTPYIDQAINDPGPRIMTTHLPRRMFEDHLSECKPYIIYPVRNPKDTLVSYYHFYNKRLQPHHHIPTFSHFFELYRHNKLWMGNFFDHVHAWYSNKDLDGTLVVKYEDLKKDTRGQIHRMAHYLKHHLTDAQVDAIIDHTSFDNMKARPELRHGSHKSRVGKDIDGQNLFVRKGEVGGWREYFTVAQSEYVDQQYEAMLAGTGLVFDYVL